MSSSSTAPCPQVLSPCDVNLLAPGERAVFGGRVLDARDQHLLLGDALSTVQVQLLTASAPAILGALVTVQATCSPQGLIDGLIVAQYPTHRGEARAAEHDRLYRQGVGRNLQLRDEMLRSVRGWFALQHFIEVDTPQRVPSPGLDLHLDAFAAEPLYLITSPEYQMKRLLCGGLPRIFQLVHCFRDGEVGHWHNPEFLMLEWYRAFAGIDEVMRDTEQLLAHLAIALTGSPVVQRQGVSLDLTPPYERLTVCQAFDRFASVPPEQTLDWADTDPDRYFEVLVDKVEPAIHALNRPVFLQDFPAPQASLARLRADDSRVCERFELYVGGLELCNGFGELTDPIEQRQRLERDQRHRTEQNKPVYPIDHRFLEALVDGMPPSGGNALGLDRVLALCVGASALEQVLPFPASWL